MRRDHKNGVFVPVLRRSAHKKTKLDMRDETMYCMKSLLKYCAGFLMTGMSLVAQAHEGSDNGLSSVGRGLEVLERESAEAISSAEFLQKIHANNLAEIDMGQMVMERGNSDEIRTYGRILVRDHVLLDSMVKQVADYLNVDLDGEAVNGEVAAFKKDLAAMSEKLAQTSDEDFRATLRTVSIDSHEVALVLLNRAEKSAPDLSVRLLARTSEPVIRRHLSLAKQL